MGFIFGRRPTLVYTEFGNHTCEKMVPLAIQLNTLTLILGLTACNSRTNSDKEGNHTFNRLQSSSLLDYFLLDSQLWPTLIDMAIIPCSDSDHNALSLDMKMSVPISLIQS